jgi:hypothetical protein
MRSCAAKDPASKETQEFDAALLDEEGIHLEAALDPESTVLEQEQREQEEPDHGARPFLLKWPMQPAPSGQPQWTGTCSDLSKISVFHIYNN